MKPFIAFINLLNPLPKKSSDKLLAITRIKDLKKGDTITNTEEKPNDFYILKSGIIRSFYTDKNGKEYIRQIFTSSMATGALGALILNGISRLSYDCLSNCEVYAINFKDFKNGEYKMIMTFAKQARGFMARYIIDTNAKTIDDVKAFNYEGYNFSEPMSTETELVFIR